VRIRFRDHRLRGMARIRFRDHRVRGMVRIRFHVRQLPDS
jgi:hypothetical protein